MVQAPLLAAVASFSEWIENRVPQIPGQTIFAAEQSVLQQNSGADALVQIDTDDVPRRVGEYRFGNHGQIILIFQIDRTVDSVAFQMFGRQMLQHFVS